MNNEERIEFKRVETVVVSSCGCRPGCVLLRGLDHESGRVFIIHVDTEEAEDIGRSLLEITGDHP